MCLKCSAAAHAVANYFPNLMDAGSSSHCIRDEHFVWGILDTVQAQT